MNDRSPTFTGHEDSERAGLGRLLKATVGDHREIFATSHCSLFRSAARYRPRVETYGLRGNISDCNTETSASKDQGGDPQALQLCTHVQAPGRRGWFCRSTGRFHQCTWIHHQQGCFFSRACHLLHRLEVWGSASKRRSISRNGVERPVCRANEGR